MNNSWPYNFTYYIHIHAHYIVHIFRSAAQYLFGIFFMRLFDGKKKGILTACKLTILRRRFRFGAGCELCIYVGNYIHTIPERKLPPIQ